MRSYKNTHFVATPPTLLLIPSTLSTAFSITAAPASTENVKIYSAITVSIRVNIIYK